MSEQRRTASEIRAYCEAATKGPWWWDQKTECVATPAGYTAALSEREQKSDMPLRDSDADGTFIAFARTDLPAVLDAAVKLREAYVTSLCSWLGLTVDELMQTRREGSLIAETEWLKEGDDGGA